MVYDTSHMQLTPQEIEDLRREMREDYQWMKEQLHKEREQREKREQNSDGVR